MSDYRTIHGATSEINLPGLESKRIELVRWDGDVLRLNDMAYQQLADVIRVTDIGGLFDDAPIRQERSPRPDTYGSRGGLSMYDEKVITLDGYVKAGNFPMLRKLQRNIKRHLAFKTIRHSDDETWKLRFLANTYYENLITNPNFEVNKTGWTAYDGAGSGNVTIARNSIAAHNGSNGLLITRNSSTGAMGASWLGATRPGVYTFGAWVKGTNGWPGWLYNEYIIDGQLQSQATVQQFTFNGSFQYVTMQYVVPDGVVSQNKVYVIAPGARVAADTFSLDSAILVPDAYTGAYFDGSTGGGKWDGATNASISYIGNRYELLYVQPGGIQMAERQDDGNYKRPFLVTLKAGDPRIYTPEVATTWLYAATPKTLTIGGDVPSPVKIRINGPITNPIVTITQTAGSSPATYAEEIAVKLTTVINSGQYVDFDPWENTLVHSAGSSLVMTTGNHYNDLAPGTYTVAVTGSSTDGSTSVTVTQRDAIS